MDMEIFVYRLSVTLKRAKSHAFSRYLDWYEHTLDKGPSIENIIAVKG